MGGKRAIAEFLATDDYAETNEVIAIVKGKDGGGSFFDVGDALPAAYRGPQNSSRGPGVGTVLERESSVVSSSITRITSEQFVMLARFYSWVAERMLYIKARLP